MKFNGARRFTSTLLSTVAPAALSGVVSGAPGFVRRWRSVLASALVVSALAACSSVPDAVNPVSWYEGVSGWFDDDEDQTAEYDDDDDDDDDSWFGSDDDDEEDDDDGWWLFGDDDDDEEMENAEAQDGDGDGFPNLASVPERPAAAHSGNIAKGLAADPNRPEYAPAITRQGEAQLALGAPQPAGASGAAAQQQVSGAYQPAPDAVPKAPVTAAALTQAGQGVLPPPAPEFAAAPMAAPATPPYPQPAVPGGRIVLTPPSSVPVVQTQIAALGPTPMPAVLNDTSSQHAFEAFRAQMRQGAGAAGAQFAYSPYTAAHGGAGGPVQHKTVVISSGGVSAVPLSYSGGYASAPISGGPMPSSAMAAGFAAPQAAGVGGGVGGGAQSSAALSGFSVMNSRRTVLAPGSVKVATILFNNGSTSLKGEDSGILNQVASLQRQKGGAVRVIGHASSRTRTMDPNRHRRVNYEVSAGRAAAVASALVNLGVPREAIVVGAVADAEPLFYEVMPSGEAGNRRTEIYLDT